jgi:hypothetical protein
MSALAPQLATCLVGCALHREAVGDRAARERALSTRQQLLAIGRSCMRVDLTWSELCIRVREHARQLVGASAADLFLCNSGGRELLSTMAGISRVDPDGSIGESGHSHDGGGGANAEETVRLKVAWLLQAGEEDAITLAARAVESGLTVVVNAQLLPEGGSDAAASGALGPLAEELSHAPPAEGGGTAEANGAIASTGLSSVAVVSVASVPPNVGSGVREPARPSRFAVVLRSAAPGRGGAPSAKVGAIVVERPQAFGTAEVELFAELVQHLGATVEMHRARWETLALLERERANAGRHALLLNAARATLRTYATYDGCFEIAHSMAEPLGAAELNLYLVRRVDAHEAALIPFAVGTPVLFTRMPSAETRGAVAEGRRVQLADAYAPVAGILGHVASTGQMVSTADAQIHPLFNAKVDQLSTRFGGKEASSLLVVPVRDSLRHVVGVLQCSGRRSASRFAHEPPLPRAFADAEGDGAFTVEDAEFLEVRACPPPPFHRASAAAIRCARVERARERELSCDGCSRLHRLCGAHLCSFHPSLLLTRLTPAGVRPPALLSIAAGEAACAGWCAGREPAGGVDPPAGHGEGGGEL